MIDASELSSEQREKLTRLIESGYEDLEITNCRRCNRADCWERGLPERLPDGVMGGKGLCPRLSEKAERDEEKSRL